MNLRNKFIWNILIALSFLSLIWFGWSLYNINYNANKLYDTFISEQVGTDDTLENKVNELEKIYALRKNMEFKTNYNPFDLSRAVSADGFGGGGKKGQMWVTGNMTTGKGILAFITYKGKRFTVAKGDSIAGGIITDITDDAVTFEKNNTTKKFHKGIDY